MGGEEEDVVGGGCGGSDELDVGGTEVDDGGTGLEKSFSYALFSLFPFKKRISDS